MLVQNVHWVRDKTGIQGKAPIAMQLGLTHFVDDGYDVLCDIQTHFRDCHMQLPQLYLVPTTTMERCGPNMRLTDMHPTIPKLWRHIPENSIHYAKGLSAVPLPSPPDAWRT